MRIGTDLSIQECRAEGYMVMDYPVHAFRKNPTSTICRFTVSKPDYIRLGYVGEKIIYIDEEFDYADLWEMYETYKDEIDSFVGFTRKKSKTPSPYDLLSLASDIDAYCGISTQ